MIHGVKELIDTPVTAKDGELGLVREIYLDDQNWIVRYVAVSLDDEGDVLLSPAVFQHREAGSPLTSALARETVFGSPRFDLSQPVTRVQETQLHSYYSWPFYWLAGGLASYPLVELAAEMRENESAAMEDDPQTQHLRGVSLLFDGHIQARDGEIGSISDLLIEDEAWGILYLVVDTGSWLPGKKVLLSPSLVEKIDWLTGEVSMDLSVETIKNSPEYDPYSPVDDEYHRRLRDHYRKPE